MLSTGIIIFNLDSGATIRGGRVNGAETFKGGRALRLQKSSLSALERQATMSAISHTVYYTTAEDGTFLVASIDTPRFCVGGATELEAFGKAKRALEYYDSIKDKFRNISPRETRVISPFYQEKELCAD